MLAVACNFSWRFWGIWSNAISSNTDSCIDLTTVGLGRHGRVERYGIWMLFAKQTVVQPDWCSPLKTTQTASKLRLLSSPDTHKRVCLLWKIFLRQNFVDKVQSSNGCALVHCMAGISRSPTLVIAYVMHTLKLPYDEAYRCVTMFQLRLSCSIAWFGFQVCEGETAWNFPQLQFSWTVGGVWQKSEERGELCRKQDFESRHHEKAPVLDFDCGFFV